MNTSNTNDYSVFKDALGKRIQLLRTAASLTQEALAANSGLTRTTIVDIEKGATNPTLEDSLALHLHWDSRCPTCSLPV